MEALTGGLTGQQLLAVILTNIVAFLILLWLLKKYAWGPLLGVIDQRRDKIRTDFAKAEKQVQDAERLRADFEHKLADIKNIERERVQEAVKRGEVIAQRLESDARTHAKEILAKGTTDLEHEVRSAKLELRSQVVGMAIAAAEMVVKEKLDDTKHRRLVEDFIQQLGDVRA
jgi:F-type H+-transporting ATPase subunit b